MSNIENVENISPVDENTKVEDVKNDEQKVDQPEQQTETSVNVEPKVSGDVKAEEVTEDEIDADDDDNDDDEEDDDEEDEEPETRSPEELTALGKQSLSEQKWEDAIEFMEGALRRKIEIDNLDDNAISFDLAELYLRYGDALLTKEEHSSELFVWDNAVEGLTSEELETANSAEVEPAENTPVAEEVKDDVKEEAPAAKDGDDEDAEHNEVEGDMQLAWESLEMSRVCFNTRMPTPPTTPEDHAKETEEEKAVRVRTVIDASYATIRLADLLILQEKYSESLEEYKNALELRKAHGLHFTTFIACALPLAQLEQSLGNKEAAEEAYKYVTSLMEEALQCSDEIVDSERKETYRKAAVEIADSIKSLSENVEEGAVESGEFTSHLQTAKEAAAEAAATVRERMRLGKDIQMNEDGAAVLGESKLEGGAGEETVVVVSARARDVEENEDEDAPKKKRRVVISDN